MNYISLCCDKNYLEYATTLIRSIGANNMNKKISFYIFFGGDESILINSGIKELIESFGFVFNYHIFGNSVGENLKTCTYLGKSTYYRLYIPNILLSKGIKKTLYLDIDIICNNNIEDIFNTDINNKLFAVSMENSKKTFNCGVMYINNEEREKRSLTDVLIHYIETNPNEIIAGDQSAMNNILKSNDYLKLKPRYNLSIQYRYYRKHNTNYKKNYIKKEIQEGVLFHFNAKKKPWHYLCLHPKAYLWYKYKKNNSIKDFLKLFINFMFSNFANIVFRTQIINKIYNIKLFKKVFLLIMTGHK